MNDMVWAREPDSLCVVVNILPGKPRGALVVHVVELVCPLLGDSDSQVGSMLVKVVRRRPHDVQVLVTVAYSEVCSAGTSIPAIYRPSICQA